MTVDPTPAAAPSTVRTAFVLYIVRGVLDLVGAVLALVLLPQTVELARRTLGPQLRSQGTQGVDVDAVVTATALGATAVSVGVGVVFGVLTIVFAFRMRRGRNWARIVLVVFAALSLLGLAGAGSAGAGPAAVTAIGVVAAVTAAVLSLLPSSNPWFRRRPQAPAAG